MADAKSRALLAAGCLCCLALGACDRQGRDEMSWARAALARNERLEIVATDPQSRSFTVRIKDTGEVRVVRADQLVGSPAPPASPGVASTGTKAPGAPAGPPAETAVAETGPAWKGTAGEATEAPAPSAPKVFASRALKPGSQAPPVPGQVLEAGPGYTIEAGSGPAEAPPAAPVLREAGAGAPAVEVRREPIVCQGARLLHIDNLNLQFEGDAVSAEDGCEIHITNSRIRATGVGVSARAANVHIDNSLIEGDTASIDAADGAQIYAASSRFKGLSRRLDTAAVHDLGGNVWN